MLTMSYLFRAYSDQSGGINGLDLFAPICFEKSLSTTVLDNVLQMNGNMAKCLTDALQWKCNDNIPFIFWTESFLHALLYALYKRVVKQETNIHLFCLNTKTATNAEDRMIAFTRPSMLMEEYGVSIIHEDKKEVLSKGLLFPGEGSYNLSLDVLLRSGLYHLHPTLEQVFRRYKPRWLLLAKDLEQLWSKHTILLTNTHLDQAATLASTALAVGNRSMFPNCVFAAFLSLQKRTFNDHHLISWIAKHSTDIGKDYKQKQHSSAAVMNHIGQLEILLQLLESENLFFDPANVRKDAEVELQGELEAWRLFKRTSIAGRDVARVQFDRNPFTRGRLVRRAHKHAAQHQYVQQRQLRVARHPHELRVGKRRRH